MKKNGFTLVELIAVIIILSVLVLLVAPVVIDLIDDSEEKTAIMQAKFYLEAVELSIYNLELENKYVTDGSYKIMPNGNLCLGSITKNTCNGEVIKIQDEGKAPDSGTIEIKASEIGTVNLIIENKKVIKNTDGNLVCIEHSNENKNVTPESCFETIPNYEYTINKEACIIAFSDSLDKTFGTGTAEIICSGDKTYGDIINIAYAAGYTIEQLKTSGVISNEKDKGTLSIVGYTCGGEEGTKGAIRDVVVPSKIDNKEVTKIGAGTFFTKSISDLNTTIENKIINSIGLSDTIKEIEFGAFLSNQLTSVTLGNSVTTIGGSAFSSNQLTSVTIPDSVTTIGHSAFHNNQLTSVSIGDSVTTIGNYAFAYNQLTSVTIPDSVTTIGDFAFEQNQLTSVSIGDSVTTIGESAFYENQLTSVTIPNSVTTIGEDAFNRNKITSVTIGSGITSIGDYAFDSSQKDGYGPNAIENVYINRNSSDVTIGDYAFGWADGYNETNHLHWNSTGPTQ